MKTAALALIMSALVCADLFAHGVEPSDATSEMSAGIKTVRFIYSTGDPMSYAKTRVYPPSSPDTEILQSLCDRNGYFSFVADEAGEWRVTVEDGMGHKGEITVMAGDASGAAGNGSSDAEQSDASAGLKGLPLVLRCILGLSLILNVFAVWFIVVNRSKLRGAAAGVVGGGSAGGAKTGEARDAH